MPDPTKDDGSRDPHHRQIISHAIDPICQRLALFHAACTGRGLLLAIGQRPAIHEPRDSADDGVDGVAEQIEVNPELCGPFEKNGIFAELFDHARKSHWPKELADFEHLFDELDSFTKGLLERSSRIQADLFSKINLEIGWKVKFNTTRAYANYERIALFICERQLGFKVERMKIEPKALPTDTSHWTPEQFMAGMGSSSGANWINCFHGERERYKGIIDELIAETPESKALREKVEALAERASILGETFKMLSQGTSLPGKCSEMAKGKEDSIHYPTPAGATWDQVQMTFRDNESVKISVAGGKTSVYYFPQMGFKDRRGGKPNIPWEILRTCFSADGTLNWDAVRRMSGKKISRFGPSHIQRLGKTLREFMQLEEKPFDSYGKGYQLRFKLVVPEEAAQDTED